MVNVRKTMTDEEIAERLAHGEAQFNAIMAQITALTEEVKQLAEGVRPLVENAETLKGVAEVTRAAGIWRKFFVGALGLLVLIGAAGGVLAGIALGVKHWIIEGSVQG